MIAAAFYLLVVGVRTGRLLPRIPRSQMKVALLSGVFLTIHFTTWIASLSLTSVASSVVLVQSAPVFVAIGSTLFLGEKPARLMITGILVTLAGSVLIGFHDFRLDGTSLAGNLLAVSGAIGAAGYIIAGRNLRRHLDTFTYVAAVYAISAVLLLLLAAGTGTPLTGFHGRTYLLLLAIAVFPQIIGHTAFNWGLEHLSATTISIILLGEPVGASILALFLLGEPLGIGRVTGGGVILCGVALVLLAESRGLRVHGRLAMSGKTKRDGSAVGPGHGDGTSSPDP